MTEKKCVEAARKTFPLLLAMAEKGNPASASDAGVGALAARAACRGAELNVRINASGLKDPAPAQPLIARAADILREAEALEAQILEIVNGHING